MQSAFIMWVFFQKRLRDPKITTKVQTVFKISLDQVSVSIFKALMC